MSRYVTMWQLIPSHRGRPWWTLPWSVMRTAMMGHGALMSPSHQTSRFRFFTDRHLLGNLNWLFYFVRWCTSLTCGSKDDRFLLVISWQMYPQLISFPSACQEWFITQTQTSHFCAREVKHNLAMETEISKTNPTRYSTASHGPKKHFFAFAFHF